MRDGSVKLKVFARSAPTSIGRIYAPVDGIFRIADGEGDERVYTDLFDQVRNEALYITPHAQ